MQEDKRSSSAYFLTLTYDTAHVPITAKGYMTLQKSDVQKFFKRLRKNHEVEGIKTKIKYYVAGEYGGKTYRPHYHIILFNASLHLIDKSWKKGVIHYGTVGGASVGYTLKYMMKPSKIPLHNNDDRVPEFSLMSKGLGENYLTNATREWHEADMEGRTYLPIDGGKKIALPRYYKDKLYTKEQREHIGVKAQQRADREFQKRWNKMLELHGERAAAVQVEINKAAFKKMYHDATKNRNGV